MSSKTLDISITSLDKHPRAIENGGKGIFRARARARDFPANYPGPSLRENARSV